MGKCKWCGESASVNSHGYCEKCNEMIREDIKRNKTILDELAAKATPSLSGEEKTRIADDADTAYLALKGYKEKRVPFFKSDIDAARRAVFSALDMAAPAPAPAFVQAPAPVPAALPAGGGVARSTAKPMTKRSWIFVAVLSSVLILLIVLFSFWVEKKFNNDMPLEYYLRLAAQQAVTDELLSPSSAKFPTDEKDYAILAVDGTDDEFVISSYVDADNAFGASLRRVYVVKLRYDFEKKGYSVLDVAIDADDVLHSADAHSNNAALSSAQELISTYQPQADAVTAYVESVISDVYKDDTFNVHTTLGTKEPVGEYYYVTVRINMAGDVAAAQAAAKEIYEAIADPPYKISGFSLDAFDDVKNVTIASIIRYPDEAEYTCIANGETSNFS